MMEVEYIVGLSVGVVITLIGIIYRIVANNVTANSKEIKRVDCETDSRLDSIEKDIVKIQIKIQK